jgi:hypothetical protein
MSMHEAKPTFFRAACALLALFGLIGCGPTMPAQTIAPGPGAPAQSATPVDVDSSRMTTSVRPSDGAPCVGRTYPIDGRAAYDAAARSAIAGSSPGAIRRVRVYGERLTFSHGAGPAMLGQVMLAPTATIVTRVRIETTAGRTDAMIYSNGMGRRSLNGFVGCAALGEALADAYRESLRDMSNQIADSLYLVGSSFASVPPPLRGGR